MKKVIISMICLYFWNCSPTLAQDSLITWQKQLYSMKHNLNKENKGDLEYLFLLNYTYKGVIKSEDKKAMLIDSMLADNSPNILRKPFLIEKDTVYLNVESYKIIETRYPKFDIISIAKTKEIAELIGEKDLILRTRLELEELIKIGFEYLELEWDYKGDKYYSICIVSNDKGGIVFEPIGSNILTSVITEEECVGGR